MAGKFEVYQDRAGKYRFRLNASNGQVVATREAYEKGRGEEGLRVGPTRRRRRARRRKRRLSRGKSGCERRTRMTAGLRCSVYCGHVVNESVIGTLSPWCSGATRASGLARSGRAPRVPAW